MLERMSFSESKRSEVLMTCGLTRKVKVLVLSYFTLSWC